MKTSRVESIPVIVPAAGACVYWPILLLRSAADFSRAVVASGAVLSSSLEIIFSSNEFVNVRASISAGLAENFLGVLRDLAVFKGGHRRRDPSEPAPPGALSQSHPF